MKPLAIITGVGPGTGSAMVRCFHDGGFQVAMIARSAERLATLEQDLPDAFAMPCDVSDSAALNATLAAIEARAGTPKVVIHNAVGGAFGNFLDIAPDILERNFQVNVMALLHLSRWATPPYGSGGRWIADCDGQYLILARQGEFCRLRADEGSAAHPG